MNNDIKVPRMLVITETGEKLGPLSKIDALRHAQNAGLDLVLVSPDGNPPVAKLMDYSKYRFEQQKRTKEMKKNQKVITLKEVRLTPTIEKHDFDTKLKNAIKFLEKGDKVKVSLKFNGRVIRLQDGGRKIFAEFQKELEVYATIEVFPKMDGRQLFMILAPKNDK